MRCSAALSTEVDSGVAFAEVVEQARDRLGATPNLAALFFSPHHHDDLEQHLEALHRSLDGAVLMGCSGESIVGSGREIEQSPAVALWLASLPGAQLLPMHLEFDPSQEGGLFRGWHPQLDEPWPDGASLLLLGEPFSFPADVLLARFNADRPGMPVFGGMASGGWAPRQNRLVWNGQVFDGGAVALLMDGSLRVRTVVSQGCRPIGRPLVITKSERNAILELGGKPALAQLREIWPSLTAPEQRAAQQGLHVGQVVDEYRDRFDCGDFLVRNVVGADPNTGAIAVGDFVRTGQTMQFHIRDAESADEELRALLAAARDSGARPAGGLMFTCNGRGQRLFETPDHDASAVVASFPDLPLAGFFAQGEIGPIGRANYLHGFTASLALFEAA